MIILIYIYIWILKKRLKCIFGFWPMVFGTSNVPNLWEGAHDLESHHFGCFCETKITCSI